MNWWQQLKQNGLARAGAIVLILMYLSVIAAEFVAPYNPYGSQDDGSLLPPTAIHWTNPQGSWIGAHVYPTTQGRTDINTGDRLLKIDTTKPSPINLFVRGDKYQLFSLSIPLIPKFDPTTSKKSKDKAPVVKTKTDAQELKIFEGITCDWHLFGTSGAGKLNLLGTDEQGRDQFSRIVYGGRISLFIGLIGVLISFPIGMILGGISGYFGGWIDAAIMRVAEVLMTLPSLYLLVALASVLPDRVSSSQRFLLIIIITSFISWAGLARVIRGQVLSIKEREFVQAARAMGAKPLYIILRHVIPQTATYAIISATLAIPSFIVSESVLSLIGLGIQPPDPSWGNLLSVATNTSILIFQPWLIWPPALLIILTVLSFNLLGDGLRDALDPRNLQISSSKVEI
ncbi:ABC transporter permease [Chamaesiphon sp. VAR_48_metabat_403]|uniref:ABC transporter permease n=1 Tax=Chamaesiphon sp. VAR_48_metabat_403 TaxID=2964700 RepID=UPI00286E9FCD|nr:ABC transporter permease [Chamaesiphon sp. VAR_48_metabat_403]